MFPMPQAPIVLRLLILLLPPPSYYRYFHLSFEFAGKDLEQMPGLIQENPAIGDSSAVLAKFQMPDGISLARVRGVWWGAIKSVEAGPSSTLFRKFQVGGSPGGATGGDDDSYYYYYYCYYCYCYHYHYNYHYHHHHHHHHHH